MIEEGVTIGKKAHTEAADAAVAATCTTAGKTAGSHCSVCGETIVAQTVVAALGHTPAAAVTENEEAAQPGIAGSYDEVVYCGVCGAEVSRTTVTTNPLPEPQHTSARQVTYYTLSFYEDAGAAVQNVKVKAGTRSASLTWDRNKFADVYVIYRATTKNGKFKKIASTNDLGYTVTGLTSGKVYYFKVRAVRKLDTGNYYSADSAIKKVTVK